MTTPTARPDGVAPATWKVVLSDWFNAGARVTITLKSGAQFSGEVDRHPTTWLHDMACLHERGNHARPERRHTVDMTEIAGITAAAQ